MNIHMVHGTGEGQTALSAFDAALFEAGIANYNLIRLSSVIPRSSRIILGEWQPAKDEYGHRLYVVMASGEQCEAGKQVYAGLGWICSDRGGVFMEHSAPSEGEVVDTIRGALDSVRNYRKLDGAIDLKVVGRTCVGHPVSAVVAAVYKSEGWE